MRRSSPSVRPCVRCGGCSLAFWAPKPDAENPCSLVECAHCAYRVEVPGRASQEELILHWNQERARLLDEHDRLKCRLEEIEALFANDPVA